MIVILRLIAGFLYGILLRKFGIDALIIGIVLFGLGMFDYAWTEVN